MRGVFLSSSSIAAKSSAGISILLLQRKKDASEASLCFIWGN
jgi:hypothetical protein